MSLNPGARLGPYEIVAPLGAGGMGEVYRARDTRLKRDVAVKILPDTFARDPERLARFQREAELLASVNHTNIAAIYGLEQIGDATAIVMELVEGETLADVIARGAGPGLPLDEVLATARQIADALEAAHEKGVIHRDLKPANIKITPAGKVKVLDFGLAKMIEPESASSSLTMSPTLSVQATSAGVILGTAAYMSPEQARGKPVDRRTDIWAFGCILFELLTGKQAVEAGETVSDAIAAVLKSDPDWNALPPDTPPHIRALILRCLQKDPHKRLRDIGDARIDIEEGPSASAAAAVTGIGTTPPERRRRSVLMVFSGLAGGVGLTAAAAWAFGQFGPAPALQPMRFAIVPAAAHPLATTFTGRQIAISPDGKNLVYVSGTAGGFSQLIVRAIDRLEAEPLRGTSNARFPFISPDGKWIGFFEGTELKKVSLNGGAPITLCQIAGTPRGASWGSDDTIVFATSDAGTGLLAVPAGGGESRVLTRPDVAHGEQDHLFPSVLAGGRTVLFTITVPGPIENSQIVALDLETGKRKTLIRGGSQAEAVQSGHLVYGTAGTLRAVRFDPERLEVLSDPVPVVEQIGMLSTGAADFAVSDTGTLVFIPGTFASIAGSGAARSLVWVDRHGREEPIKAPVRSYFALRLSPDGTRIALDARDQDNDIWVWDIARETLTRLTVDPGPDVFPIWTPDGRRIVFGTTRDGAAQSLFWQPADGAAIAERLTTATVPHYPNSFSPDGTRLLLQYGGQISSGTAAADSPASDISVMAMDGDRKVAPLLQTKFIKRNAEVSPDGRWVAYESNESGRFQIYVQPFPNVNSGRWQISTAGGTKALWARSGGELFYVDGSGAVMTVPIQTTTAFSNGTPARLLEAKYFHGVQQSRSYDVSRDGQRFLLIKDVPATAADGRTTTETPASMVVVVNWFEELKQRLPLK
jgi:serine/threonine-protein kinase